MYLADLESDRGRSNRHAIQNATFEDPLLTRRKLLHAVLQPPMPIRFVEKVVREESLGGKGVVKVRMVLTGEGTGLRHVVEGEIDLG